MYIIELILSLIINIPSDDEAECSLLVDGRVLDNTSGEARSVLGAARDTPQIYHVDAQL